VLKKPDPGLAQRERRRDCNFGLGPKFELLRARRAFVGFEYAVQTAQHREGKDDLSVFGLFEVASQEIGDGPEKRGKIGFGHRLFSDSSGGAVFPRTRSGRIVRGPSNTRPRIHDRGDNTVLRKPARPL
jgi:hypothetical protein